MGNFEIDKYVVSFGLFLIVIVGGVGLLYAISADVQSESGSDVPLEYTEEFNHTFNSYADFSASADEVKDSMSIKNATGIEKVTGIFDGILSSVFLFFGGVFTTFGFVNDAFNGLALYLQIDPVIISIVITMIAILIGFAIAYALMRGR